MKSEMQSNTIQKVALEDATSSFIQHIPQTLLRAAVSRCGMMGPESALVRHGL